MLGLPLRLKLSLLGEFSSLSLEILDITVQKAILHCLCFVKH